MEVFLVHLVLAGITAAIANERGRSPVAWFVIGLFLQCVALIIVLVLPDLREQQLHRQSLEDANRRLRERVRKDRQVFETRHAQLSRRIDVHDETLGQDTRRQIGSEQVPALPDVEGVEWYYAAAGEPHGPVRFAVLRELFRDRSIDGDTLVWCEHMTDWAPIADLGDLEDALCA